MTVLMLDVDGVLVTGAPTPGFVRDAARDAMLDIARQTLTADDWQLLATGKADLLEMVRTRIAVTDPEGLLDYLYRSETEIDADVLAGVKRVRTAGMPVFLATNQEHRRARYLMETLALSAMVDGIVHSAALGHRKPSLEYFAAAAAKVGAKARDIVFIDDNEGNVAAARVAGWRATHWLGDLSLDDAISAAR
jgi:putative hydrolase of the HAD superfamily